MSLSSPSSSSSPSGGGVRSARERLLQTLAFEAGGLLIVTPLYAWASRAGAAQSFALLTVLAAVVMSWAALFNTAFDVLEHRLTGRVASARPQRVRLLHALLHEASALLLTWPVIVAMTGADWAAALMTDVALTLAYAGYAYLFHVVYDRWRPVRVLTA
ncbi:MAG: PACE efflux transporter [Burkholderiales bacterium]|nr:PACE efflux transporter [Burkholderiales bacterium]